MSAITFDEFLALCDGVVDCGGDRYQALCPCHDDHNPSLHFQRGDRVEIVAHCWVCRDGAPFERIVEALKSGTWAADPKERKPAKRRPRGRCVAQHEYRRADGAYAYDKLRYRYMDPETGESFKTLAYRRMPPGFDPEETVWGRGDEAPLLYNLEEIAAAEPSRPIYCFEGESDVDAAVALGFTATCTDGGAWDPGTDPGRKWCEAFETPLHGFERVVICRDFDPAGLEYSTFWASRLYGKVASVKVLTLPGLKEKGDFRDWVDAGGTADEFVRLANEAPEWKPPATEPPKAAKLGVPPIESLDLAEIARNGIPPLDWILEKWVARKDIALAAGAGGIGKSTLAADAAVALSAGRPWLGITPERAYRVGVVDEEQSTETAVRLYLRLGATPGNIYIASAQDVRLDTDDGAARLEAWIVENKIEVVVLDGVQQVFGSIERKDAGQVAVVFGRLFRIRNTHGTTFLMLAPKRKDFHGGAGNTLDAVLDSVAFANLSDTVWLCIPASPDSLNVTQCKRRGGTKTSIVATYREEDDRIILTGGGPVENTAGAVERCSVWIRTLLLDRAGAMRRSEIVGLGAKVPAPEGPCRERTIDDALKLLLKLGTTEKPKQGWYQIRRQGTLSEEAAS